VQSLSLIMVIGYDEVGFLVLNVVNKSTKTIIVVVATLHEFSLSLQQRATRGGQHWKLAENYCNYKKL